MFCSTLPFSSHTPAVGFHGVMVSTQDSESCDPSSNLGGTYNFSPTILIFRISCSTLNKE